MDTQSGSTQGGMLIADSDPKLQEQIISWCHVLMAFSSFLGRTAGLNLIFCAQLTGSREGQGLLTLLKKFLGYINVMRYILDLFGYFRNPLSVALIR